MVNLEKSGEKLKSDVLDAYALVSEIIDFNIVNFSSSYSISATPTGIIKDVLFATVVIDIPTFCIPNA